MEGSHSCNRQHCTYTARFDPQRIEILADKTLLLSGLVTTLIMLAIVL